MMENQEMQKEKHDKERIIRIKLVEKNNKLVEEKK